MGLTADEIATTTFTTARKGYEPLEVDRFLRRVADVLRQLEQRAPSEFDQLGGEVASVLQSAKESAAAIVRDAEAEADRLRQAAEAETADQRSDTTRLRAEAETLLEETRAHTAELVREAEEYAATNRESAEEYALGVRTGADEYAERTRARADEYEAQQRKRIDRAVAEAEARAEDEATVHSQRVLREAQDRLDHMLAAERIVRDRIAAALTGMGHALAEVPAKLDVDFSAVAAAEAESEDPAEEKSTAGVAPDAGARAVWAAVGESLSAASQAHG